MEHGGQCFCGEVTFSVASEPLSARFCWCRDCQRIASGSATVNVLFDEASVQYSGPITRITRVADSGNTVERGFCSVCGSQMYSRTLSDPTLPMRVRAGTLDDPEICPPSMIIWGASAPSWAPFPPGMTILEAGPGSAKLAQRQVLPNQNP
ncbi:GFA family protein [Qipengyuania sp. ASV99]|uniref:GFA family protein n=1 Tax=Qipengyuania sp. ASV99 TaxID=3399681 RepID=UPI003A4C610D